VYQHEAVGFSEEELDHLANESETDAIKRRREAADLDQAPSETAASRDTNVE